MGNLARLRIELSGAAVVGPSVMTLYQDAAHVGLPSAAKTWLSALAANFPSSLTFTIPDGGDLIQDVDGALEGTWSDGGGGVVTGTGTQGFLQGTGARVVWGTSGVTNNRRVKGSTFLVPLAAGDFDTSGMMAPASYTSLDTPTQSFLSTMGTALMIWSRPRKAWVYKGVSHPARAGTSHSVISATVDRHVTTLRSRRT